MSTTQWPCQITGCADRFDSHAALLQHHCHMHVVLEEKHFACHGCPQRFTSRAALMTHMSHKHPIRLADLPYPCTHCSRRFADRHQVTLHPKELAATVAMSPPTEEEVEAFFVNVV